MSVILDLQVVIITQLQERLVDAIANGDWSASEQWNKNLAIAGSVFNKLSNQEEIMALKDKIDTLTAAIADRDKQIAVLKQKEVELNEAEASADKVISTLQNASTSASSVPTPPTVVS